ncbi:MAG: hypothetical protein V3581_03950 [Candidatus Cardinium sp.]|uniref:hypothetical protein n=1 Tax=Candidatus Cardinium sp. TP TaxID=2961955 RepID=UPI0021AFE00F|nr:hypothetical protein [Candidatus Cardinium sp. TP]MCT4697044.1 hypothetical protein [Candidatus Cardinium sp. TP]MDN5246662.1 hypothetical protein [Candidatus Cardinium sp.]
MEGFLSLSRAIDKTGQNELKYKPMRYRQHNTYSRHLVSVLICCILIVLGGASCLHAIQAAWPGSYAPYSGSASELCSRSIGEDHSVPEQEAVYLYKDALLFALDHSVTFAKQLKRRVEQCIMQLTPDAITALQGARISLIEVLEGNICTINHG